MSELYYDPCPVPLSLLGRVMPGCQYTFYITGTTTLTPIYADEGLSGQLDNPLTSDANGRFPPIYVDPAIVYRVQLHDADGTLLYDVDPVHPHAVFPPGTIVMFNGTAAARDIAYPPSLWQVCDGSNGTPDLRDRSPLGVSDTRAIGTTGGGTSITTDSSGAHEHAVTVDSTILSSDNMPIHHHRLWVDTSSDTDASVFAWAHQSQIGVGGKGLVTGGFLETNGAGQQIVEDTGSDAPSGHTHTASTADDGAHQHSFTFIHPYATVWFLQRKA